MSQNISFIEKEITDALRNRQEVKLSTLRMLLSELRNTEIDLRAKGSEVTEDVYYSVLKREAKKRRESIEIFEKAGRVDLSDREKAELDVINKYLPAQKSEAEISAIIDQVIAENPTEKNFGLLMKKAMDELKDTAEGSIVVKILKSKI
jgi:uncharacterized protein YqeY